MIADNFVRYFVPSIRSGLNFVLVAFALSRQMLK